jgi:hypothetical protein
MQRIYSSFPMGRPGIALLMLRLALATMLFSGVGKILLPQGLTGLAVASLVTALFLGLGLLAPVVATLCVALKLAIVAVSPGGFESLHMCACLVALALVLLGPGAYSLDAKLFGRKQLVIPAMDGIWKA